MPRPLTQLETIETYKQQMMTEQEEFIFDNDQNKKYIENWTKMKNIKQSGRTNRYMRSKNQDIDNVLEPTPVFQKTFDVLRRDNEEHSR